MQMQAVVQHHVSIVTVDEYFVEIAWSCTGSGADSRTKGGGGDSVSFSAAYARQQTATQHRWAGRSRHVATPCRFLNQEQPQKIAKPINVDNFLGAAKVSALSCTSLLLALSHKSNACLDLVSCMSDSRSMQACTFSFSIAFLHRRPRCFRHAQSHLGMPVSGVMHAFMSAPCRSALSLCAVVSRIQVFVESVSVSYCAAPVNTSAFTIPEPPSYISRLL